MDKLIRKKVLKKIPYGLYIVAAAAPQRSAAILVNWITQVSFDPPLIAVAIESNSDMCRLLSATGLFSVNMLPTGAVSQAKALLRESKQKNTTLSTGDFELHDERPPVLRTATDVLICRVVRSLQEGDHMLFIAEIVDGVSRSETPILTLQEAGMSYSR